MSTYLCKWAATCAKGSQNYAAGGINSESRTDWRHVQIVAAVLLYYYQV